MSNDTLDVPESEVEDAIRRTLSVQAATITRLKNEKTINEIYKSSKIIDNTDGRTVFTGVGKSGDVAKKIVATFNSIGISSHFIHPVEALHGDLGMVSDEDTVVLVSNSGNTDEIIELLQFLEYFDPKTIAITSNPKSELAQKTDHHIDTQVHDEGAIVDLVPMASTTATMVIGDCIANALMHRRGFDRQDFGHFHPGGTIGKRLLLDVKDIMHTEIPKTKRTDTLAEVGIKVSEGGKGIAVVQDSSETVLGIITDGDFRRLIESNTNFHNVVAEDVMVTNPITVSPSTSAIKALEIIEENDITQLVVTNSKNVFIGVVHIHDIMKEGLGN